MPNFVLFDAFGSGSKHLYLPGIPTAQKLGFVQFTRGSHAGRLQPISFNQSILIPDFPGSNGGNIWCKPDVNWRAVPFQVPHSTGISIGTATGILNFCKGIYDGLTNGNLTHGGFGPVVGINIAGSAPGAVGGSAAQVAMLNSGGAYDEFGFGTNAPFLLSVLAFAADIAQKAVMANIAETQEGPTFVNVPTLIAPTDGVPLYAFIQCPSVPSGEGYQFGKVGVPMLGHFAWDYDGYKGPINYLNSSDVWSNPPLPNATGIYIIPKPGVNLEVTLGVSEFQQMGIVNSLGAINFLAGVTAGLDY